MERFFVCCDYYGINFHGWQVQKNKKTVQYTIEKILSTIFQRDVDIVGCGRTDSGVHARNYIFHFDCDKNSDLIKNDKLLLHKLNVMAGDDIFFKSIYPVTQTAHARFDALDRRYTYFISKQKNPFSQTIAYHKKEKIDIDFLNKISKTLIGRKDFQCFSKSNTDVNNYFCEIHEAYWEENSEKIMFHIRANRFLRNMVRSIVGTLLEIYDKNKNEGYLLDIIQNKRRELVGKTMPAQGLFFEGANYPKHIYLSI